MKLCFTQIHLNGCKYKSLTLRVWNHYLDFLSGELILFEELTSVEKLGNYEDVRVASPENVLILAHHLGTKMPEQIDPDQGSLGFLFCL